MEKGRAKMSAVNSTKTKAIALALALLVAIVAIVAVYFYFEGKKDDNMKTTNNIESNTATDLDVKKDANDSFVFVSGGAFTMGSPESEAYRDPDEVSHSVSVPSVYVDPYEVTQADYSSVMGDNPSHFKGDNLPVENVTWYDAVEYCNKKSAIAGLTPAYNITGTDVSWDRSANGYRLLTEAEWEYVCRAGSTTPFPTGNFMNTDEANYQGSYPYLIEEHYSFGTTPDGISRDRYFGTNRGETIGVNSLVPNAFGIYNMNGNVSEWCFDYYADYDTSTTSDTGGPASGSLRINRGGGYNDFCKHLRSAYRSATNPLDVDQNLGFRICRNAEAGAGTVQTSESLNITIPENPKILVAYFSYSGNTESAAKTIADMTGADIFEIERASGNYGSVYSESAEELASWTKPELKNHVSDMSSYDVILLGYPTWWATTPMPVVSFLEEYDLSGKTVVVFSSHGGTMFGDSVSQVSKLALNSRIGIGYEFNYSSSSSQAISEWLKENGVPEK